MMLKPKDLTTEKLQGFLDAGKSREWIMAEYGFKSIGWFYKITDDLGCAPAKSEKPPKEKPERTTTAEKEQMDILKVQGLSCSDISKFMGIRYQLVYSHINRHQKAQNEKFKKASQPKRKRTTQESRGEAIKPCEVNTTSSSTYVDTGRIMPQAYHSNLTVIVDKDLAEIACKQMGLGSPVASLSERPRSLHRNGWVRSNGQWIPGIDANISGRVSCVGVGRQL